MDKDQPENYPNVEERSRIHVLGEERKLQKSPEMGSRNARLVDVYGTVMRTALSTFTSILSGQERPVYLRRG